MNKLVKTGIVDKNGVVTTRNKRQDDVTAVNRVASVSAPAGYLIDPKETYVHNHEFSGDDYNVPVVARGEVIPQSDSGNWHVASDGEVAVYETYWNALGDAEDAGSSEEEARAIADTAVTNLSKAETEEALRKGQTTVGKKYRLSGGEIVKVIKVEATGSGIAQSNPTLRFTVTDQNGEEFDFLNSQLLSGMKELRKASGYSSQDEFRADDTDYLGMSMGKPFTAESIFDIAVLSGDADYPKARYPILTGFGVSLGIGDEGGGTRFEFTSIDGERKEYVIPSDKLEELSKISIQPLRGKWDTFDPDTLR